MKKKGPKKSADPLKLTCVKTDCKNDRHAFRPDKKMIEQGREGECLECHQKLVDFAQTRQRDLNAVDKTFAQMKREYVRHWFWTQPLNPLARGRAQARGLTATEHDMRKRIRTAIGKALPFRDGYQTPIENPKNIVYWAQHATASCCRRCVEYWHGIPRGRELSDDEVEYLLQLAMRYIRERLDEPPSQASSSSSSEDTAE